MWGRIKRWWRRKKWDSLARGCREMRKHPERYDINKMLGIKPMKPGELQKLRELLDEYKEKVQGGVEDVQTKRD